MFPKGNTAIAFQSVFIASPRWPQECKYSTLLGKEGRIQVRHGGNALLIGRHNRKVLSSLRKNGKEVYQMEEIGRPNLCLKPESQAE